MIDSKDVQVSAESFLKLPDRIKYNYTIADFYDNLAESTVADVNPDSLNKIAERIRHCSSDWDIDWFRLQNTKAIIKTNRCRDKFCLNCQSSLALAREHKFAPVLNDIAEKKDIYHCIFTIPNCKGTFLRSNIKCMYTSFSYFVRYLNERAKIKNFSFSPFGFSGGIKSLEITYNEESDTYHPHFHCLLCFSKDLVLNKYITNTYSFSKNSDEVIYFSEEEILFQKIWYLLVNGQLNKVINPKTHNLVVAEEFKVNKKNIDNLDLGYSVVMNKADRSDYKEVFKYAFKNNFDKDKCLGEEQFRLYRKALRNIRFIQAYGDLIDYDFSDDCISAEDLDIAYEEYKSQLYDVEEPMRVFEKYTEMLTNMQNNKYTYITSGSIRSFLLDDTMTRLTDESKDILSSFDEKI